MSEVPLAGTERLTLHSEIVGQDYLIDIHLPASYGKSDQTYPVLYVPDGNNTFGLVSQTLRFLDLYDEVAEVIAVGIGYPDILTMRSTMGHRTRDFTPTSNTWYDNVYVNTVPDAPAYLGSGGAANFLHFIRQELMPLVNGRYRTDPAHTTLKGHSFGGLFALNTLLTEPDAFSHYLVGSPSVWWDGMALLNIEEAYAAQHKELPANVFMTVGGLEPPFMIGDTYRMAQILSSRNYAGLNLKTVFIEDETHKSSVPAFTVKSLRHIYGRGNWVQSAFQGKDKR